MRDYILVLLLTAFSSQLYSQTNTNEKENRDSTRAKKVENYLSITLYPEYIGQLNMNEGQELFLNIDTISYDWYEKLEEVLLGQNTPEISFKKSPLKGIWMEKENKTDFIIFHPVYDGQYPIFYLQFENRNGVPRKYGDGPYWYKLSGNYIHTKWFLSSNSNFQIYYFKMSEDSSSFDISIFYDSPYLGNDTLTFIKFEKNN